jgi:hypothetical protein
LPGGNKNQGAISVVRLVWTRRYSRSQEWLSSAKAATATITQQTKGIMNTSGEMALDSLPPADQQTVTPVACGCDIVTGVA